MGLTLIEVDESNAHRFDIPAGMTGLLVQRVEPFSAAYDAGILRGQILLEVNRQAVSSVAGYRRAVQASRPGDVLAVFLYDPRPRAARHSHRPHGAPLKPRILVVDDEASIRDTLRMILEYEGYDVLQAATGEDGVRMIEREAPDLVFLDIKMPGMDGLEVLQKVRHLTDSTPIVVISGHVEQGGASSSEAVEAMKLGARDFIEKPPTQDRILVTVRNALDTSRLRSENRSFKRDVEKRYQIVGDSPLAAGACGTPIHKAAPTNATVLIWGESGVGKELVARAIHRESLRRDGPFVQVNCAAIPDELIESELFGHEKGSFTGATDRQIGKFEQADKGTIFLDEVGDMSLKTQAKVLRVLQEQELERLGSNRVIKVDVRVIAATNKNLEEEIDTRRVPRRSVLPPQRHADSRAGAARPARGRAVAGPALRRPAGAREQLPPQDVLRAVDGEAEAAALARQHPRAAERRRAAPDHDDAATASTRATCRTKGRRARESANAAAAAAGGTPYVPSAELVWTRCRRCRSSRASPSAPIWWRSCARTAGTSRRPPK